MIISLSTLSTAVSASAGCNNRALESHVRENLSVYGTHVRTGARTLPNGQVVIAYAYEIDGEERAGTERFSSCDSGGSDPLEIIEAAIQ